MQPKAIDTVYLINIFYIKSHMITLQLHTLRAGAKHYKMHFNHDLPFDSAKYYIRHFMKSKKQ